MSFPALLKILSVKYFSFTKSSGTNLISYYVEFAANFNTLKNILKPNVACR